MDLLLQVDRFKSSPSKEARSKTCCRINCSTSMPARPCIAERCFLSGLTFSFRDEPAPLICKCGTLWDWCMLQADLGFRAWSYSQYVRNPATWQITSERCLLHGWLSCSGSKKAWQPQSTDLQNPERRLNSPWRPGTPPCYPLPMSGSPLKTLGEAIKCELCYNYLVTNQSSEPSWLASEGFPHPLRMKILVLICKMPIEALSPKYLQAALIVFLLL